MVLDLDTAGMVVPMLHLLPRTKLFHVMVTLLERKHSVIEGIVAPMIILQLLHLIVLNPNLSMIHIIGLDYLIALHHTLELIQK